MDYIGIWRKAAASGNSVCFRRNSWTRSGKYLRVTDDTTLVRTRTGRFKKWDFPAKDIAGEDWEFCVPHGGDKYPYKRSGASG